MIRLRPFKLSDAKYLMEWFDEEEAFVKWSAGKFLFPLTMEQLEYYYDTYQEDEYGWSMIALNEEGIPVGHFLMRMADYKKNSIHMGFIVVNPNLRGHGYGKEMLTKALKYAFELLNVDRVTLAVYDNNLAAHNCYKAIGFVDERYEENNFAYKDQKWGTYYMANMKQASKNKDRGK